MIYLFRLILVGFCITSSSWAQDLTPHGTQPQTLSVDLEPVSNCQTCHASQTTCANDEDCFLPHDSWSGSMMAHAGRDPLFWASLDVANADLPGSGDFCLRCHAPKAWMAGRINKTANQAVFGTDGCLMQGAMDQSSSDFDGVECDVCHRMTTHQTTAENANWQINQDGTKNGPYSDAFSPAHPTQYSAYHESSASCGVCHNVTSPALNLIDADGSDTGIAMPIERTYMEWQNSFHGQMLFSDSAEQQAEEKGQSCQDCHMPSSQHPNATASNLGGPNRTGQLPQHDLLGGNTFMLNIIKGEYGQQLGIADNLQRSIEKTETFLQTAAALEAQLNEIDAQHYTAEVKVTNLTGHKLPTGYPEGRRIWLYLALKDESEQILWQNGYWNPLTGELAEDAQTRIYETLPGIWDNQTSSCKTEDTQQNKLFHFVLNNCIAKDTRIPPKGFSGQNNPEIQSIGLSYPEISPQSGVSVHYDQAQYAITLTSAPQSNVRLTAQLLYQSASKAYVDFLENQAVLNASPNDCSPRNTPSASGVDYNQSRGKIMKDLWTAYGKSTPVVMAETSVN